MSRALKRLIVFDSVRGVPNVHPAELMFMLPFVCKTKERKSHCVCKCLCKLRERGGRIHTKLLTSETSGQWLWEAYSCFLCKPLYCQIWYNERALFCDLRNSAKQRNKKNMIEIAFIKKRNHRSDRFMNKDIHHSVNYNSRSWK